MSKGKRGGKLQQRLARLKREGERRTRAPQAAHVVEHASRLLDQGKPEEARDELSRYDDAHPDHPAVLRLLCAAYCDLGMLGQETDTAIRLLRQTPDDPNLHLAVASLHVSAGQLGLAAQEFREFLRLAPTDPLAEGVRTTLAVLQLEFDKLSDAVPSLRSLSSEHRLQSIAAHDEVVKCLEHGQYDRGVQVGEQLLARHPDFVNVRNNVCQCRFYLGDFQRAIEMTREVLASDPHNIQALGNLARFLLIVGQAGEARALAARMRQASGTSFESWAKKAETFSALGDEDSVIEAFEGAQAAGALVNPQSGFMHHLAAVAHARQGSASEARKLWKAAFEIDPTLDVAVENLKDSRQPIEERHGPWPFGLNHWLPRARIDRLISSKSSRRRDQELTECPELESLAPVLLDRGDPPGRDLIIMAAKAFRTPSLLEALRSFCLSQRGTDQQRMQAALFLREQGILPVGPQRLWLNGEWRDVELRSLEVYDEPKKRQHSEEVLELMKAAHEALNAGDGRRAEELLQQAIESEPDQPDLLNNLAAAYELQDRTEESVALAKAIHERWPDYFFARVTVARDAIRRGRFGEAEDLLKPLQRVDRLHRSEHSALSAVHVELLTAKQELDKAASWLESWEQMSPDDPNIEPLRTRLDMLALVQAAERRATHKR